MKRLFLICSLTSFALLGGCASTHLTEHGQEARVLRANQVSSCKYLGLTTVQMPAKFIGIPLPHKDVNRNLQVLARNATQALHGDTVVPVGPPNDGMQTFRVYRCINP